MLVEALAAARVTRLVTRDTVTRPAREHVGRLEAEGRVPLGSWEFVRCPWCVGVWAALLVMVTRRRGRWLWRVLAAAEVAGLLAGR